MMVEVKNLCKRYGHFTAVDDISFSIPPHHIFGFLGVNGAGKTTTLRILAGILQPSGGSLIIDGKDLIREPLAVKAITGYIPDRPYLYERLTAREFLNFIADLYSLAPAQAAKKREELLEYFSLNDWADEMIEGFSHGMKQRLVTCAALIHSPKLLIVDEPMVGLDPHGAKLLKDSFRRFREEGMTIILSTHSLNVAEEVADGLAIIDHGKIIARGSLAEMKAQAGAGDSTLENLFLRITTTNGSEEISAL